MPNLVSVVKLYKFCGVSRQTIYNWIQRGFIKPRGFGRPDGGVGRNGNLYDLDEVIEFAKSRNLFISSIDDVRPLAIPSTVVEALKYKGFIKNDEQSN